MNLTLLCCGNALCIRRRNMNFLPLAWIPHTPLLYLSLVALLSLRCQDTLSSDNISAIKGKVLFQYEHINKAWGYQHEGWFIDSAGLVHCYHLPAKWHFYTETDIVPEDSLYANLYSTDSVCYQIPTHELSTYFAMIQDIASGMSLKEVGTAFDAGTYCYYIYEYHPLTKSYKPYLILEWGDYTRLHSSPSAIALFKWLSSIDSRITHPKPIDTREFISSLW